MDIDLSKKKTNTIILLRSYFLGKLENFSRKMFFIAEKQKLEHYK